MSPRGDLENQRLRSELDALDTLSKERSYAASQSLSAEKTKRAQAEQRERAVMDELGALTEITHALEAEADALRKENAVLRRERVETGGDRADLMSEVDDHRAELEMTRRVRIRIPMSSTPCMRLTLTWPRYQKRK